MSNFDISADQLSTLHDPKSVKAYEEIFGGLNVDFLYNKLSTDIEDGISTDNASQLDERIKKYGDNRFPEHVPKTFLQLVRAAFDDKTMLLLTAAAIVSFLLGLYELFFQPPQYDPEGNEITKVNWIEGVAIMFAVVVVVTVSAANDYQKELQFVKLNRKKESDKKFVVIRNGGAVDMIHTDELLVGDIVKLQTGDIIPADCILVDGECESDESSITGESDTIKKVPITDSIEYMKNENDSNLDITTDEDFPDCMLISGSKLISGLGRAVVTAVGANSIHGRTMLSLRGKSSRNGEDDEEEDDDTTPLQERLSGLADYISVYGCAVATLLFVILFSKFLYNIFSPNGKFVDLTPTQKGTKFLNIFITAITIIVVAVPEGLPLAVTLALAFATTRMTEDGSLVRVLRACETMGSVTAICSDKTGTLTENVMSVIKSVIGGSTVENIKGVSQELKQDILINIVLNSTAFENREFHESQDEANPFNDPASAEHTKKIEPYVGSKTETALLAFAKEWLDLDNLGVLQNVRTSPQTKFSSIEKIIQVVPFESSRKWSAIIVKLNNTGKYRLYLKGAAEIVFKSCTQETLADNSVVEINDEVEQKIQKKINDFATDALRAISLAHKDFDDVSNWPPTNLVDEHSPKKNEVCADRLYEHLLNSTGKSGAVLDGIFGIKDPLRDGVKDSVKQCQNSGITVRMVTGDNLITAKAIARNCQILDEAAFYDEETAMEGPKFRKLDDNRRKQVLKKLRVLARSSPEDKRLLVGTLKAMGEVVAVTGDGTNDAPALKLADVGFSMGISGTEVAREASDIILMKDDFASIVVAIKWGRCVVVSIKKFIQFQLTVNITAVVLTFVSAIVSEDETSVLTAVQLLWVNLIMDTLAALALATDKPDPNIMNKMPKGRSDNLIAVSTWKMIICQSILQLVITFTLHFHGSKLFFGGDKDLSGFEQQQLNALTFNTFVWLQFFTLIVSRKLDEGDGISSWKKRFTQANLNFFQDLFRNYYFIGIISVIGIFQCIIMKFGGVAFSIAPQTFSMWVFAISSGLLSIPVGFFVRLCPDEVVSRLVTNRVADCIKYVCCFQFLNNDDGTIKEDQEALLSRDGSPALTGTDS